MNAIKAFVKFCDTYPDEEVYFVIAGKHGWKNADYDRLTERAHHRIIETGMVSDDDLPVLYSMAMGLVYVSFHEGFGLSNYGIMLGTLHGMREFELPMTLEHLESFKKTLSAFSPGKKSFTSSAKKVRIGAIKPVKLFKRW